MSAEGHEWVESHKEEAEKYGLMVRIYETYEQHYAMLIANGINPDEPVYYNTNHLSLTRGV
jgi:hypothetical protein